MIARISEARVVIFGETCRILVDSSADKLSDLFEQVKIELLRIERKFSYYHPDSLVASLNKSAGTGSFTPTDPESRSLLTYVTALWDNSSHLFDPTTRLLQECYHTDGRLLASPEQLKGMLQLVGWSKLEIGESGARLTKKGMLIDLDSCVRPYAIDSAKKILLRAGVAHAMIEMKRDIATIGKQPDGSNWLIGVRLPRQSRSAITRLKLNDRCFALRGNFSRCSIQSGERFGRALSPVDGQPIPGPLSVATVADSCLTACSAASIARLKTEAASLGWLQELDYPWLAVDRHLACHGPLLQRA